MHLQHRRHLSDHTAMQHGSTHSRPGRRNLLFSPLGGGKGEGGGLDRGRRGEGGRGGVLEASLPRGGHGQFEEDWGIAEPHTSAAASRGLWVKQRTSGRGTRARAAEGD